MKPIFSLFFVLTVSFTAWNQCVVIGTAMPQPASCADVCDGEIVYVYQNTNMASPGAPYIVTLSDSDGNVIDIQTHLTEMQTILFSGLCADNYTVTVQGSGCSHTTNAVVTAPEALVLYVNTTPPVFGGSDGAAELIVSGGTPPYSYSIDGGVSFQPSNNFTGLPGGTYSGVIQDANGCLQTLNFTLTDNTPCSLVVTAIPATLPLCYGSCTGSITYLYDDANAHTPYSITLEQGGIILQTATNTSPNGTGTFTNLCAGIYTVHVTDYLGCTGMYTVTLAQPPQLTISSVTTTNSTAGTANGTATVNVTGGQPAYNYSLDGISWQAGNNFTGLSAGVHIAYVMDSNGCIALFTFVIQQNPGCDFNITTMADTVSCPGNCDGSVVYTFSGTGSDMPFSIVLESGGTIIQTAVNPAAMVTGTFTGLCGGSYLLTVGNSSGCEQVANVIINEPAPLTVSAATQPASTGNNDGQILVSVLGGTAPYQYSIDNQASWQSSSIFGSLGAGIYVIWVEDANGCMGIYTVELLDTSTCTFIIEIATTETSCVDDCDGTLTCTFNDTDVNPPYVIQLMQGGEVIDTSGVFSDFSGLHQFSGLCAGVYAVAVVDADGCTDVQNVYIDGPDYMQVTGVNVDDASSGGSDGSAEIIVTGGTAPYQFTINDGVTWQTENVFNGLDSGFYILMVQDAHGCIFIYCFIVNEEPGCDITTTFFESSPITCYGACDGIITYSYFEAVSTPPYYVNLIANSGIIETDTFTTNNFTGFWDTLCPATYSISVTNGNGCMAYVPNVTMTQPAELLLSGTVTDASVGGTNGFIELNATGGTGQHLYGLDGINYQTSTVFENFAPGTYIAYAIDANDCSDTLLFEILENPECNIGLTTLADEMLLCTGACNGSISIAYDDVNSNPPYSALLTNGDGTTTALALGSNTAGTGLFTNLCAGVYNVSVTDGSGCYSATSSVTIEEPPYLQIDVDEVSPTDGNYNGSITLNVSGGTAPYEFSTNNQVTWSNTNTWFNLSAGFYIIHVRDANGCVQLICIVLSDLDVSSVIEVNKEISVYPNPTPGIVFVESQAIQIVTVYDLTGQRVELPVTVASNGVALDLSGKAAGIYVLEIKTHQGEIQRVQVVKN